MTPWLSHTARIAAISPEINDVLTYRLELTDEAVTNAYRFAPGQFNMLYLPGCGEVAISMSGPSEPDARSSGLLHTIRAVGRVTEALAVLEVGDQLGLRGPYGSTWPVAACEQRDVILLAGGIGLAPLRPVIYALMAQPHRTERNILLMGARTPDLMLYADEFAQWQQRGWEVITTVDHSDSNWTGHVGVVPQLLKQVTAMRPERTLVMTCGPEIMMHYAAVGAIECGIASESIWVSLERHMQCAVGLCGHCQLGPSFVCKDGPVYRYDHACQFMRIKEW